MIKLFAISPEKILEIKNTLTIIKLEADILFGRLKYVRDENGPKEIIKQVERIDGLLPAIKYEKEHKCHAIE